MLHESFLMLYWWEKMFFRVSVLQMKTGCQGDMSPFQFHIKMCFELQLTLFFTFENIYEMSALDCSYQKHVWKRNGIDCCTLLVWSNLWILMMSGSSLAWENWLTFLAEKCPRKILWTFLGTWGWVGGDGSRGATLNRWTEIGDSSCNVIPMWPESYTSSPSRHHRGRWEIK